MMTSWTTEKELDRPSTAQISNVELIDRQRKIYKLIKDGTVNGTINGTINTQNISVILGISLRTTKRDLYVLLSSM